MMQRRLAKRRPTVWRRWIAAQDVWTTQRRETRSFGRKEVLLRVGVERDG